MWSTTLTHHRWTSEEVRHLEEKSSRGFRFLQHRHNTEPCAISEPRNQTIVTNTLWYQCQWRCFRNKHLAPPTTDPPQKQTSDGSNANEDPPQKPSIWWVQYQMRSSSAIKIWSISKPTKMLQIYSDHFAQWRYLTTNQTTADQRIHHTSNVWCHSKQPTATSDQIASRPRLTTSKKLH